MKKQLLSLSMLLSGVTLFGAAGPRPELEESEHGELIQLSKNLDATTHLWNDYKNKVISWQNLGKLIEKPSGTVDREAANVFWRIVTDLYIPPRRSAVISYPGKPAPEPDAAERELRSQIAEKNESLRADILKFLI